MDTDAVVLRIHFNLIANGFIHSRILHKGATFPISPSQTLLAEERSRVLCQTGKRYIMKILPRSFG